MSSLNIDQPETLCRRATVHEKGDKDRTVIMSKAAFNAMKDYLAVRFSISEYVFLTNAGTPLTSAGIAEILDRYKKRLEIKEPVSPHQWRHRWCRKRLQDKMPLPQVSQLAGHKTIAVTADFYGTFAIDELQEAFDRYYIEPEK
jgi:integrase/recombinase XerD